MADKKIQKFGKLKKKGFSILIFLMFFAFINDVTKLTKHQISVKKDKESEMR